jgi:uncharacterized integral membrane protein
MTADDRPPAGPPPDAAAAGRAPVPPAPPASEGATAAGPTKPAAPPRTRTSAAFKTTLAGAVVLVLLLVFILENTQSVKISYFGATGHVSLGIALLLAAAGGALLAALVGGARILQVRRFAKRRHRGGAVDRAARTG